MSEYGKYLRYLRIRAEKSLQAVSAAIGCSPGYLSDLERGRRNPLTPDKSREIAEELGASAEETIKLIGLGYRDVGKVVFDLEGASGPVVEAILTFTRLAAQMSVETAKAIVKLLNREARK